MRPIRFVRPRASYNKAVQANFMKMPQSFAALAMIFPAFSACAQTVNVFNAATREPQFAPGSLLSLAWTTSSTPRAPSSPPIGLSLQPQGASQVFSAQILSSGPYNQGLAVVP